MKSWIAALPTLPDGGAPSEANRAKLTPFFAPLLNQLLTDAAAA